METLNTQNMDQSIFALKLALELSYADILTSGAKEQLRHEIDLALLNADKKIETLVNKTLNLVLKISYYENITENVKKHLRLQINHALKIENPQKNEKIQYDDSLFFKKKKQFKLRKIFDSILTK